MQTEAERLTKQQAAERLGLGVRRTLGMEADKTLKTRNVRDQATHQWSVRFHARDIERYLELRRQEAEAQPILEAARTAVEDGLRPSPEAAAALEEIPTKKILEDPTGVDGTYLTRMLAITKEIAAQSQAAQAASAAAQAATVAFLNDMQRRKAAVRIPEKRYLTLDEAVEYFGRTRAYLLRLIREGNLEAVKDGGWRIRRTALDQL